MERGKMNRNEGLERVQRNLGESSASGRRPSASRILAITGSTFGYVNEAFKKIEANTPTESVERPHAQDISRAESP